MDFLSHFLAIIGLVLLVVLYKFHRIRSTSNKNKSSCKEAPEPPGAWPLIGHLHLLGGDLPVARTLAVMADKCGPVFSLRLGSHPAIVVSSWEAVKDCFTINDTIFASRPAMAMSKYFFDHAVFALAPYGPYWRDVRKMVTLELLTNSRLEKLEHVRATEIDYCIQDLHLLCQNNGDLSTTVTMNKWFEHLTFNITLRMLVGKRFSASTCSESNTEDWHVKEAIKKALYLGGVFVFSDVIPWLEWMDVGGHLKVMKQTAKELDVVIGGWLEEHKQKRRETCTTKEECDFMDVMLSTLAEDTKISGHTRDTIIKGTTMILILTGSESTGETLTWALSLLLNNRHVLKKAQDELDAVIGKHKLVEESDIKNLPYLQAIIKETLRLYPPGPLSGPREASEDCYISGYYVPKGTRLIVNLWKLHRDARVWSNPGDFEPERFLTTHANVKERGQHHEYIPFSSGRRMCPGVTFGLQVVQLTLARLLQGFNVTTPMGEPVDMNEGLGIALPKVNPLEVILKPRLPLELYQNFETPVAST